MAVTGALARGLFAALLGCAALVWSAGMARAEMRFDLVRLGDSHCGAACPVVVSAQGEIADDSAQALVSFLGESLSNGSVRSIVLLDSPGGKVMASMELGQVFRRLGMAVIVARPIAETETKGTLAAARCYSACVYALMGGLRRVVPAQSSVGVHRMFAYSTSFDMSQLSFQRARDVDDGQMLNVLSRYSRSMGVDTALVRLAERTSPDRLHVLTGREIVGWRLGVRNP